MLNWRRKCPRRCLVLRDALTSCDELLSPLLGNVGVSKGSGLSMGTVPEIVDGRTTSSERRWFSVCQCLWPKTQICAVEGLDKERCKKRRYGRYEASAERRRGNSETQTSF